LMLDSINTDNREMCKQSGNTCYKEIAHKIIVRP
jgi:hypothetical protein